MSGLPDEVREQLRRSLMRDICPSCDAGLPYGCACPDLTHLEPLIADLLAAARADAWDEGYRQAESDCGPWRYVDSPNPYRAALREASDQ